MIPLLNGHQESVEKLAAELAEEPPHPKPSGSKPVPIVIPDKINAFEVKAMLLYDVENRNSNGEAFDPDELIRSHDPEHVSGEAWWG